MTLVTLSSQNQITLSKHILDSLNLKPRDRLAIHRKSHYIILEPIIKSVAEDTYGSLAKYVTSKKAGKTVSEIIEVTKKRTAKKLAREGSPK